MNITKKEIDNLNTEVTIDLAPEDYQEQVTNILKDYRKKANMPGFRPGMVPMGMVKKMYGKAVLAEEINKIFSQQLYDFINKNELEVLGQPLPKESDENRIDLDKDSFSFTYDLAISPKFEISLSDKDKFDIYKIEIDEKLIDKYVKDIAKRYGKVQQVDVAGEDDMLQGTFTEIDSKGNAVADGIQHTSTISVEYIEDKKAQDKLSGVKDGETIKLNPADVSRGAADMAQMLGISKSKAEKLKSNFEFKVEKIFRMTPHEANQELFDKTYGPGAVKTEAEFRQRITDELEKNLEVDANRKFYKDLSDKLIAKLKLELPEDFLKRWLETSNEELDKARIDEEWDDIADSIRWQLIEGKIMRDNKLQVEHKDLIDKAKELIKAQMEQYGQTDVPEEQLDAMAANILGNEEEAKRVHDQILDEKLLNFYKDSVTLKPKEISFDDFVKLANKSNKKSNIMEGISNLMKF